MSLFPFFFVSKLFPPFLFPYFPHYHSRSLCYCALSSFNWWHWTPLLIILIVVLLHLSQSLWLQNLFVGFKNFCFGYILAISMNFYNLAFSWCPWWPLLRWLRFWHEKREMFYFSSHIHSFALPSVYLVLILCQNFYRCETTILLRQQVEELCGQVPRRAEFIFYHIVSQPWYHTNKNEIILYYILKCRSIMKIKYNKKIIIIRIK